MQVNLSSGPMLLEGPKMEARFRKVLKLVGQRLQSSNESLEGAGRPKLEAYLQHIFSFTQTPGFGQAEAATELLELAIDGCVLLPVGGPSLRALAPLDYVFKLPALLETIDAYVKKEGPRWIARDTHLQLILATDCRQAELFDIFAFAKLHSWLIEACVLESKVSLSAAPYMMLRGVELAERSSLGRDQRHGYLIWRTIELDEPLDFEGFMSDPTNMANVRVHGHERERIELPKHIERRQTRESLRKARAKEEQPPMPFIQNLLCIVETDAEDGPERYFEALTGSSNVRGFRPEFWIDTPVDYPGRQSVKVAELGAKWFVAFRAFLAHRQKDYETDKQVRSALHVLADYILLYLPWWMSKHPGTTLKLPTSPKQFLRYFYVDRTRFHSENENGLGALPKTLNEMLPLRRPTQDSRNTTRITLQMFFNFVLTYFEDNSEFVAKGMQNPIRTDFDNEVSSRRTKTNKVPFAEDVFPFLIHYGQALEAFGEFLQQQAYLRNQFRELPNGSRAGYDTGEWGYVPIFWYRGRLYPVLWAPNVYPVAKRTMQSNPPAPSGIYVQGCRVNTGAVRNVTLNFPHLTTIRMLTAMAESGLRGQSLQWLDRRTFDALAPPLSRLTELHGNALTQNYHALYINTDKAHESWDNLVSWRVRRSLLAEMYFQDAIVDKHVNKEAPYEDRENSRFVPVLALFRSRGSAKPISDNHYSTRWIIFLHGFQTFYNSKDGVDRTSSSDALAVLKKRDDWEDGASVVDNYLAIHTPHACRATYATLKDGDLEVSEIAEQLGHSNTVVTNTYQVPQLKRLVAKLKKIDEQMMGSGTYDPTGSGPAYLHPENADSTVRVAFEKSREQAIVDFGFVPGVALWSLAELDGDPSTLELLKQSPASVIRWHATHVCPVGNQCPQEVVAKTGALSRCGICPLAAKCIDHLPAIEAKQTELLERIQTSGARQRQMAERGSAQTDIDSMHREMLMDTKEMLGWKLSAEILRTRQREMGAADGGYHVDQPELVRKQLELVTRSQSESAFFLQRIADSNGYPSLESAEVRAKAARYTRLILARQGRLEEAAFLDVPKHGELAVFASMIKPYVEAKSLSLDQLAGAIDALPRVTALTSSGSTSLLPGD